MAKPLPLNDRLSIASHQAARAKNFWQIYWFYKHERAAIADVWERFPFFLQCDLLSHFIAFVISTCAVLEESRDDTANVHHLFEEMEREGLLKPEVTKFVNDELGKIALVKPKMRKLRNKLYGHRDNTRLHEDWLKQVNVTFDEMSLYGDVAISVVNALCRVRSVPEQYPLSEPLSELRRVLGKLSALPDDDPPFMKAFTA
ncbi:MAG: hypothetical protein SGI91_08410 [Alphaproteobacteria bacterium]|nr:hypothetical protein [Alphaproteobacteria bacterium]